MPFLPHDLGDGFDLVPRELSTVEEMLALTLANLARLREWEPWAQGEQTREGLARYTEALAADSAAGRHIPTVLRFDGTPIGSVTCRIDRQQGVAELGYWIDAAFEGRGTITRACRAIVEELAREGITRVEIHAATGNDRSRRVAERLGFSLERVRPKSFPVAGVRHDLAIYVLQLSDEPSDQ
ncbi:MAG: ribosomal-protein-serine acetyltransferase [Subtercola sp.]|nr:ribosomal-protein-serine acetyltransferase [Subtercola sp.]